MKGWAVIDGPYRYHLMREWGPGAKVLWVMLNPSIADAEIDDPTIRRCISFSQREGYSGLQVVNLFGLITTRPVHLREADDPVGPMNRTTIAISLMLVKRAIVAWGAAVDQVPAAAAERDFVLNTAKAYKVNVSSLGTTKAGHPRHPLYLPKNTELQ